MQEIHIQCAREHLFTLLDTYTAHFKACGNEDLDHVFDYGFSQKRQGGHLIVHYQDLADPAFLTDLDQDGLVLDYTVWSISECNPDPFGEARLLLLDESERQVHPC